MSSSASSPLTIPYTDEQTNELRYVQYIQTLFPLPFPSTSYHTNDELWHRHQILIELENANLTQVALKYCRCHHPNAFRFLACEDHPEVAAHPRPNSCNQSIICQECAAKHHRALVARWNEALSFYSPSLKSYSKNYHITMTTSHQLNENSKGDVQRLMSDVTRAIKRYISALSKCARYYYSAQPGAEKVIGSRAVAARKNALYSDKIATLLWDDLKDKPSITWWARTRLKLSQGLTLKQLGIGALFSCEFGETGHKLHAHAQYHGVPINYDIFNDVWKEVSGFEVTWFVEKDSINEAVREVTKYATKLTTCPVNQIVNLYRAFSDGRRVRAIGVFHGLIAGLDDEIPVMLCEICGRRLELFSEFEYELLIQFKEGTNSNNTESKINGANAPPKPFQVTLL